MKTIKQIDMAHYINKCSFSSMLLFSILFLIGCGSNDKEKITITVLGENSSNLIDEGLKNGEDNNS